MEKWGVGNCAISQHPVTLIPIGHGTNATIEKSHDSQLGNQEFGSIDSKDNVEHNGVGFVEKSNIFPMQANFLSETALFDIIDVSSVRHELNTEMYITWAYRLTVVATLEYEGDQ